MAILPVKKIHIVVHKSIKDRFLLDLQKEGIVHITEIEESSSKAAEDLTRVNDALHQLSGHKKRNPLSMFFNMKRSMNYDEFTKAAKSFDYNKTVSELESVKIEREMAHAQLHQLEEDIALLLPWIKLKQDLRTLKTFKQTDALPTTIPSAESSNQLFEKISDIPHSIEYIDSVGPISHTIFFVKKEQSAQLKSRLIENACDIVDFKEHSGVPAKLVDSFRKEEENTRQKVEILKEKEKSLSQEIERLEAASDLLLNEFRKNEIAGALLETTRTTNIVGWILKRHIGQLDALVKKAEYAFYEEVEREPDERPPVALQNTTFSKPYEMLVKLYSMPDSKEYDPTPFLAVFFPIMFGLCITDAVYGILLILISLYLMKKVSGDKSLFRILLVGGILTIFAGAIVGGWMGDLFDYIGLPFLIRFKDAITLFNPIEQPMVFIALALGLGFIHMMIGIGIEIIDNMKNSEYSQAIFANLTWFILIPAIVMYFAIFNNSMAGKALMEIVLWFCIMSIIVASHPEGKPHALDQVVWAVIIWFLWYVVTSKAGQLLQFEYVIKLPGYAFYGFIPLVLFEITRLKKSKVVFGKIAWGFYNLYGISSYLGVLLSYVRLMALGMVTGVIAIAINKIAWMITGIPVIGIILVIVILIPSHLFNLVINALGGFIHTMRLQYIEFFGRFYSGGSKPFRPFKFETNYVEIK
jgi:V/A-type H+-transporting ATPase subunit I